MGSRKVYLGRLNLEFSLLLSGASLLLALVLAFGVGLSYYWSWFLGCNAVVFFLFRLDKSLARRKATRVPEVVLLGGMGIGGVVGALMGMLKPPRHKVLKPKFWISLAAATALHAWISLILI